MKENYENSAFDFASCVFFEEFSPLKKTSFCFYLILASLVADQWLAIFPKSF